VLTTQRTILQQRQGERKLVRINLANQQQLDVKKIAVSSTTGCALTVKGSVYCWKTSRPSSSEGKETREEAYTAKPVGGLSRAVIVDIAACANFCVGVSDEGFCYVWGRDPPSAAKPQPSLSSSLSSSSALSMTSSKSSSLAATAAASLFEPQNTALRVPHLNQVTRCFCSDSHVLAIVTLFLPRRPTLADLVQAEQRKHKYFAKEITAPSKSQQSALMSGTASSSSKKSKKAKKAAKKQKKAADDDGEGQHDYKHTSSSSKQPSLPSILTLSSYSSLDEKDLEEDYPNRVRVRYFPSLREIAQLDLVNQVNFQVALAADTIIAMI